MILSTFVICNLGLVSKYLGAMFSTEAFGVKGWIVVLIMPILTIRVDMVRKLICGTYKSSRFE